MRDCLEATTTKSSIVTERRIRYSGEEPIGGKVKFMIGRRTFRESIEAIP